MHRILVTPRAVSDRTVEIRDLRSLHYLRHVLRVRVGDRLECFDGHGRSVIGTVASSDEAALVVAVERVVQEERPLVELILAQALIKPARFEWAVEKATELGVDRIVPILTARTISRPSAAQGEAKRLRWQRIAAESARQCRRSTVPGIDPVTEFDRFVGALSECRALLPTLAVTGPSFAEALGSTQQAGCLVILIGPEGDFSPEELERATHAGVRLVSLGRSTLRSETASVACLAIVQSLQKTDGDDPGIMRA